MNVHGATPPAPEDAIREALKWVRGDHLPNFADEDRFEDGERALAALASLVAAKEAAERRADQAEGLAKAWETTCLNVGREHGERVRERDALAEALREIANPQAWQLGDPSPSQRARAALAALSEPGDERVSPRGSPQHSPGSLSAEDTTEEEQ